MGRDEYLVDINNGMDMVCKRYIKSIGIHKNEPPGMNVHVYLKGVGTIYNLVLTIHIFVACLHTTQ